MTRNRASTNFIVIHCAATPPNMDIGAADIDRWHRALGWLGIGYHWVIRRDGTVEQGRDELAVGAHEPSVNAVSVAVCLVGGVAADAKTAENNFTPEQWASLEKLVRELRERYPLTTILGHRDCPNVHKDCPSFDVKEWAASVGIN